jgi:hypothetical protein
MLKILATFGRFVGEIRNKVVIFYYLSFINKWSTEIVNRILTILLRTTIQKKLKN